ncbi:MAG: glycosyl transferase family 4, partial [Euryarchaeota archaeon HGW-Euryarchaeota-1]
MVDFLVASTIALAFLTTLGLTPVWIKMARRANLVGKDMSIFYKNEVAEMGGLAVVAGFVFAVLFYVGVLVFAFENTSNLVQILAILVTVLIITIVGFADDILGWKIGLKQWQ